MKTAKKTSSVSGDIPAVLYDKFPRQLAGIATRIFNQISQDMQWPRAWATEFVTVFPKNSHSSTPGECRNISCTNFLSKLYESFILQRARDEVTPKSKQFGGEPGCGKEHFLVKAMDKITEALEDNRAAVELTSVDFSKAFNRLGHGSCLELFAKKGALTEIIKLLTGFMCGRQMTVKIGKERSALRPVNAGAPQGSVPWCYLFNVGVDNIEEGCRYSGIRPEEPETLSASNDFPAVSTPKRVTGSSQIPCLSPIPERDDTIQIEFLPRPMNVPPWLLKPKDPRWRPADPELLKYVDDSLHISVVNMREERLVFKNGCLQKITCVPESQAMLQHITRRAEECGMKVNDGKTGLMCVSAFKATAQLRGWDCELESTDSMKFLGVTLDSDCSFRTHSRNVTMNIRRKSWALSRLKRKGMSEEYLKQVPLVRPSAEYTTVAWHSLLTKEQSHQIERQKTQAMKNILGIGLSAEKMRGTLSLETLSDMREKSVLRFATNCSKNPRFATWFPLREGRVKNLRESFGHRKIKESRY